MMRPYSASSGRTSKSVRRRQRRDKNRLKQRAKRRRLSPSLEALESRQLLAFGADVFADINAFGIGSSIETAIEFNSEVFFVADDGETGSELWKTDGTGAGTVQVKDIAPGFSGSDPRDLTVVGGELFFAAVDGDDEYDIWKTDGTESGTVRVFDADASGVYYPANFTESGGNLFFTAYEPATGYELWVSDGSSAGTVLVRDINADQSILDGPAELTDVGGTLFFSSYTNGYDNRELFKSDGTSAGTVLVANVDGDPYESSNPSHLTNVGGVLYFAADDVADGVELYKSDGTAVGTVRVADLNPSGSSYPEELTPFDGKLFFTANDGATGRQLFSTDGVSINLAADTTGVGDPSNPNGLTVVGSDLFFASEGQENSVPGQVTAVAPILTTSNSNSSSGTTAAIIDFVTLPDRGILVSKTSSATFTARTGSDRGVGQAPTSNQIGSPAVALSTLAKNDLYISDIDSGQLAVNAWDWTISDPGGLTGIDFSGFVSGSDFDGVNEGVRFELFLNGSPTPENSFDVTGGALDNWGADRDADNLAFNHAGGPTITSATVRLTFRNELPDRNDGASVDGDGNITTPQNREAFVVGASLTALGATSGSPGRELFKTDGTATDLVSNIAYVGSSNPDNLTAVGGDLFFTADDPLGTGRELWFSDGTELGTVLVKDIRTGTDVYGKPLSSGPAELIDFGGQLLFSAVDDDGDRELWASDGTTLGTDLLKNINTGSFGANVQQVTPVGGLIYFVADDGINGEAVWVADPVAETVSIAADLTPSDSDKISGLIEFDGGVAFLHDSLGIHHTFGATPATLTTNLLTTMTPTEHNDAGALFAALGSDLFFVHDNGSTGEELYKVTAGGSASLVEDLHTTAGEGSEPRELVVFDGKVFFVATHALGFDNIGREVFTTTGSGATRLLDINGDPDPDNPFGPFSLGSFPDQLTVVGSQLFFTADDGAGGGNGRELWVTTGVSATLASDIRAGTNSSDPHNLTDVDGVLYFAARDANGIEPFLSDGTDAGTFMVANVNSGDSHPDHFVSDGNGTVYFAATTSATGRELWKTDGTAGGTVIVEDLQPGADSSDPIPLIEAGSDRVLVSAIGSGLADRELWIAGGVIPGMLQAIDLRPGTLFGSDPADFIDVAGDRFFVADDGFSGRELFTLDEYAATVEQIIVSDGAAQRSSLRTMRVIFDGVVQINGTDAFDFVNTSTGDAVTEVLAVTVVNGKTIVDITFDPGASVNTNGLLLDGNYELTIDASLVTSFGLELDGDGDETVGDDRVFAAVDGFFRKFGDGDGTNFVNLFDFVAFRSTYNKGVGEPGYNEAFDNDGNNAVNLFDFVAFRGNYLT